jgi:hypothetical protein
LSFQPLLLNKILKLFKKSDIFMDATRISDGATVAMKKVATKGSELAIAQFFSSAKLKDDPGNHCVPIYDVLSIPDDPSTSILVMPYLVDFTYPPLDTVGELVDFLQQFFEVSFCYLKLFVRVLGRNFMSPGIAFHARPAHRPSAGCSSIANALRFISSPGTVAGTTL